MTDPLNADELTLLDRVVVARLAERWPGSDWPRAVADLKVTGRLTLALDDPPWVHIALYGHALVSVDRERLRMALWEDDPLGHVRAGEIR